MQRYISVAEFESQAARYGKSDYGNYLTALLKWLSRSAAADFQDFIIAGTDGRERQSQRADLSGVGCSAHGRSEPRDAGRVTPPNAKEVPMAGTRKVGEKIPLAVVGKDGIREASDNEDSMKADEERETTIAQLTESLKALRTQVEQLSSSLAKASSKASKAVSHTAEAATDTVTSTVRNYPFYSVLAASAAAFLIGRLSVIPQPSRIDRTYDRLSDLASRLQPHLIDAVRSRMR